MGIFIPIIGWFLMTVSAIPASEAKYYQNQLTYWRSVETNTTLEFWYAYEDRPFPGDIKEFFEKDKKWQEKNAKLWKKLAYVRRKIDHYENKLKNLKE